MQQLKLIKRKKKEDVWYRDKYCKLFLNELDNYHNAENTDNLKKLSYYGVKFVNKISKEKMDYEQLVELFELIETIKVALSLLTPNELITIFPISKKYNGEKYQFKDYFSTMEELKKIGMNNVIMAKIDELLWDYMNIDINLFTVNATCALSALNKVETGKGLMEMFAEENNIDIYKKYKDEITGKEYLYNPKTCKSEAIKKDIPKYLKIIK